DQRSADLVRLLERSPAIAEISQLDDTGKEQLKASGIAGTSIGSLADRSREQSFVGARANRYLTPHSRARPGGMPWFSPIYSRDSELFITIAVAGSRRNAGVIVAEVSLKPIWDIIVVFSGGRSGAAPNLHSAGDAYLVDREGRLIAHHDV